MPLVKAGGGGPLRVTGPANTYGPATFTPKTSCTIWQGIMGHTELSVSRRWP